VKIEKFNLRPMTEDGRPEYQMRSIPIHPDLEKKAADLVARFDTAWNSRDSDALASFFTEDADFQFYYGILVRGQEKIEKYFHDKVFPYLTPGLMHVTRKYKLRQVTDEVIIGDGRVDLVVMDDDGEELRVERRLKVTTVVVMDSGVWKYSAVRLMVPVKD